MTSLHEHHRRLDRAEALLAPDDRDDHQTPTLQSVISNWGSGHSSLYDASWIYTQLLQPISTTVATHAWRKRDERERGKLNLTFDEHYPHGPVQVATTLLSFPPDTSPPPAVVAWVEDLFARTDDEIDAGLDIDNHALPLPTMGTGVWLARRHWLRDGLLRWLLEDSEARIIRTVVDGYYRDGTPPAIPELTPDQRELAKVLDHHTDLPLALPANDNSSESGQQRPTAATRTSVTYWPAL